MRWIPKKIPEGRVLVHNHIQHDANFMPGENGFRAWTEFAVRRDGPVELKPLIECNCGWSGLTHYRVNLDQPD